MTDTDNPRGLPVVARYSMEEPAKGPACYRAFKMVADSEGDYILATDYEKLRAKLSERKTVHEWLNELHVPREEAGRPLCLLRRLAILRDDQAALQVNAREAARWRAITECWGGLIQHGEFMRVGISTPRWKVPLDVSSFDDAIDRRHELDDAAMAEEGRDG